MVLLYHVIDQLLPTFSFRYVSSGSKFVPFCSFLAHPTPLIHHINDDFPFFHSFPVSWGIPFIFIYCDKSISNTVLNSLSFHKVFSNFSMSYNYFSSVSYIQSKYASSTLLFLPYSNLKLTIKQLLIYKYKSGIIWIKDSCLFLVEI